MKERKLMINQLDRKLGKFKPLHDMVVPPNGWIFSIRKAINMSLRQLGARMSITAQSVHEIEEREKNGTISLSVLNQVGYALNMKFVYGFVPKQFTLEKMIEERAFEIAKEIVMRTSVSMELEDQKTSDKRLEHAIKEKAAEIKNKMPRTLWD